MSLILPFDTETTGIPNWQTPSGGDDQPHIVQLAALLVDSDTQKTIQSMDVIVRPNGWTIDQEMTDIHGITQEFAMDVGIPEKIALEMFLALHEAADLRVAHNTTFDNRIIRIATKRYSSEDVINAWKDAPYYCTMINGRKVMGGKQPKLTEAYKHFTGLDLEDAHSAMADTQACAKVYFGILDFNGEAAA